MSAQQDVTNCNSSDNIIYYFIDKIKQKRINMNNNNSAITTNSMLIDTITQKKKKNEHEQFSYNQKQHVLRAHQ